MQTICKGFGYFVLVCGIVGGIITGIMAKSFVWFFLFALSGCIYSVVFFVAAEILFWLESISDLLRSNNVNQQKQIEIGGIVKPNSNQWKCPDCGRINANYTGTCACGRSRTE